MWAKMKTTLIHDCIIFILSQTLREEEKEIAPDPDDKSGGGGKL